MFKINTKLFTGVFIVSVLFGCAKERPLDVLEKDRDLLQTGFNGTGTGALPVTLMPGSKSANGVGSGSSGFSQQTIINSSDLKRDNDVLYVSSTQGVPRFTQAVAPYVQGKERVIQLFYTENAIKGYVIEDDKEFQDNVLNNDPIVSIPVKYKSFRCRENANKECTNIEEENTDANLLWHQKDYVLPEYENIELREYDSIGADNSCYSEVESELVHHEVNADLMYFEVKKTYTRNMKNFWCIISLFRGVREWDDYMQKLEENDGYETIISFSVMRLNKIATPQYQPVEYKTYDQYFYGFFKSNEYTKGINQETEKDSYMNRWAPADNNGIRTVQYYMSREFNKPENAYLKNATIKAFDQMNAALEHGNVNLRVAIRPIKPSEELQIRPGDLRYTMVVLIEDIANSLLGYGPSVANPFTGEIVKAHTNMYKGTLERAAPRVYDGLIELEELNSANASDQQTAMANALSVVMAGNGGGATPPNSPQMKMNINDQTRLNDIMPSFDFSFLNEEMAVQPKSYVELRSDLTDYMASKSWIDSISKGLDQTNSVEKFFQNDLKVQLEKIANKGDPVAKFKKPNMRKFYEGISKFSENAFKNAGNDIEELRKVGSYSFASEKLQQSDLGTNYLNKHLNTQYHEEMMNFDALGKVGLEDIEVVPGIRDENGKLKDWTLLTDRQQRQLTEILVVHYYIPTLVHEIGHNLGLRHNFLGSADKDNYYTAEEQKKLGLKGDVRYSSIMDYNYSSLNGLSTFGPYDLATMRFGYNRTVDTEDGNRVPINGDILSEFLLNPNAPRLKSYRYCTDENAGASIECDRFDEGSDDLELTNHYIETYYNRYKYANRKNRSRNFSEYQIGRHIDGRFFHMLQLRRVHEKWQAYYDILQAPSAEAGLPYNMAVVGCTPQFRAGNADLCATLDKLIPANQRIGEFFLDIIKTPQWTCHFRRTGKVNGQIVQGAEGRDEFYAIDSQFHGQLWVELADNLSKTLRPEKTGFTVVKSCFDKEVHDVFENFFTDQFKQLCAQNNIPANSCEFTFEMVGEAGKPLTDVDAAPRFDERQYASDIEVRGMWTEKLLAAHFLTFRHNIVTAGSDFLRSYVDHPNFTAEIVNLVEHLAYGRPLQGVPKFKNKQGGTYEAPAFTLDLNERIPVASYTHELLNWLFGTPNAEANVGGFELAPYLLEQIANSSFVDLWELESDPIFLSNAKLFHDFMSVHWLGKTGFEGNQDFQNQITGEYYFPHRKWKARSTEENGLAQYMITHLDVKDKQGNVTKKGQRTLNFEAIKAIETRLNNPAPAVTPTPVEGPAVGETATTVTEEEMAAEEVAETETAAAATPASTAGTDLVFKVYNYKAMFETYIREVSTIINLTQNPNITQDQFNQIIGQLQREWGMDKFGAVAFVYNSLTDQNVTNDEKALRQMDVMDLFYFLIPDEGRAEMNRRMYKGLYSLPGQGRTNNSAIFDIRINIEGDN
jgi:hypothetical protein